MKYPDRIFQVWDASPTKSRLLLRSPKTEAQGWQENIDILFFGVSHLDIPFSFRGLEIIEARKLEQIGYVGELKANDKIFVLTSEGKRGFIIASGYKILANDLDIFESSLETT